MTQALAVNVRMQPARGVIVSLRGGRKRLPLGEISRMTLQRLAALANVSTATVSRALSGKGSLAASTRERIVRLAREIGYEPLGHGSALAKGKSGVVGVVPARAKPVELSAWDACQINGIIEGISVERGEVLLVGEGAEGSVPSAIARRSVDGVILMTRVHDRIRDWLRSRRFPCVSINTEVAEDADSVIPDDAQGVEEAIRYLGSLGHRRIGYVNTIWGQALSDIRAVGIRQLAYVRVMAELGLRAPAGSDLFAPLEERLAHLVANDRPTALLCFDDAVADRIIRLLGQRGLRVPEDMSVVGIDDLPGSVFNFSDLTTIHVPFREMGRRAAELMLMRVADPDRPMERVTLPERIVVRRTTRAI